jgi:hypothetical protein
MVSKTNEGATEASRANFVDADEEIRLEDKLAADEDAWLSEVLPSDDDDDDEEEDDDDDFRLEDDAPSGPTPMIQHPAHLLLLF